MMFRIVFFFLLLFFTSSSWANDNTPLSCPDYQIIIEYQHHFKDTINDSTVANVVKFKRGKAILFTIFTGFLGGHRIYLGSHHRTPILYSITLGGLGILPIIDLVNIIFTKDISKFENVPQIIMWGK